MNTLIFRNKKLQGILKLTEQATIFRATYDEAVSAYEKDTNIAYNDDIDSLDRYYNHDNPTIWLVKDEGIYLMTSAKLDIFPDDKSHVCYAEGFEPNTTDCWEKCRAALGGDDLVVSFKFSDPLKKGIQNGADVYIHISADNLEIQLVYH